MTGTVTFHYDEVRLGRWMEQQDRRGGHPLDCRRGADRRRAFRNRRVAARRVRDPVRHGARRSERLRRRVGRRQRSSYEAGLEVREPDAPVYGSLELPHRRLRHERRRKRLVITRRPRAAGASAARRTGSCATTAS